MNNLIKTIAVLEDGKLSAFTFDNEEIYIQPKIVVDTLDDNFTVRVRGEDGNVVNVDVTVESIDGVSFAGSFAALETLLREMANKANAKAVGTGDLSEELVSINNRLIRDAGNSLSVSEKTILGNYVMDFNDISALIDRQGTGTFTYINGVVRMAATAGTYAVCQTYQVHPYFAGKSQDIEITFQRFANEVGAVKKVGYFDTDRVAPYNTSYDGFYLEADGSTYNLVIANANLGTEVRIPMSNWDNQTISLDFNNFSIMKIDFLYLGGSAVRFFFKTNNGFELAHTYYHANNIVGTIVASPALPLRWEIRSATGTTSMEQICGAVSTGGAIALSGQQLSTPVDINPVNANTSGTAYLLAAIRMKDKKKALLALRATAMATTNDNVQVVILVNPTIAGSPVWTEFVDDKAQALGVEYAKGDSTLNPSSTTCTGGQLVWSSPLSQANREIKSDGVSLNRKPGVSLDGVADVFALAAIPLASGTNADVYGDLTIQIN